MNEDKPAWHTLSPEQALERLGSTPEGLDEELARERLEQYGENQVGGQHEVSAWKVLYHQFQSPLIYVLFGALIAVIAVSAITRESHWADVVVIAIVLVVNGSIGFVQEYRAEHAVEELMKMVAPKATVRRGGRNEVIEASKLVPGDIVIIGEGKVVPADLRVIEVRSLQVNEAPLTGESVPVNKTDKAMSTAEQKLGPGDQNNMVFMGTAVTSGRAKAVVVATGRRTEIGRIAEQVEAAGETQTPLQERIQRLAVWISGGILIVCAIAFGAGLLMGEHWASMLMLVVALAVSAVPEGLPIVVTVALAIGVRRMAEHNAVIRRLPAVETLGSCTTIVSDKTGTLTENRMVVESAHAGGVRYELGGSDQGDIHGREDNRALYELLLAGVLCNDAELREADQDESDQGDPMEVALLGAAKQAKLEIEPLRERYPRIDEVPFQTERRFMATIHATPDDEAEFSSPLVVVKGAPEAVLDMCAAARGADGDNVDLDRDALREENDALAGQGLRVIAMAIGQGEAAVRAVKQADGSGELTFVGMQAMLDPPRRSVVAAVDRCHGAGIRVIMVTGDHARTAAAIAHEVHIDRPVEFAQLGPSMLGQRETVAIAGAEPDSAADELPEVHTGQEIKQLSDPDLDDMLARTNVFARVEPTQKTRLVERLMATGQIVAVTGDGVNDAPALKTAHIGAAMGAGTDAAKEASDMVITDNDFASIYRAVEEGRTAFRNIRMATFFLLSTGAAEVLLILVALAARWPLPLLPAQILWCNVVTNGIADVALAFEPGEEALYRRPPRPPDEGVLDRVMIERLVVVGVWLAVGTLGMFLWKWGFDFGEWEAGAEQNLTLARTAALTALILFQIVHVFNCRSEDVSLFRKNPLGNKVLFLGVLVSLGVHVAAVHMTWGQELLSLAPLDAATWLWSAGIAATAIIVNELHKWLRPKRPRKSKGSS
jgi:magnesium-transporting ATPase (P-type)